MGCGDSLSSVYRRMPWVLQYYIILLPLAMSVVSVDDREHQLPPIYWNSTSSIFYVSNQDNEIDINIGDAIDIICPQYPDETPWQYMEYYTIYMVNRTSYDDCVIYNVSDKSVRMLVNCSYPRSNPPVLYTLLIKKFQSIPGNPDFKPGKSYYFITTSHGTYHGITNQYKGACLKKNMRIMLNVRHDNSTTQKPYVPPSTTQGHVDRTSPHPTHTTRPTTRTTTTSTTTKSTTTAKQTTAKQYTPKPTDKDIPGNLPDEKVIHAGGPKNVGLISDNSGHRTILNLGILLASMIVAILCR